jgi:hypothetical protein
MRHTLVTVALAGSLGLTGAVLLSPSLASAATGTPVSGVGDRVAAIRKALEGLVSDKTLTPAQADKVAGTLSQQLPPGGPGGFGPGRHRGGHGGAGLRPDAVAQALGITVDQLRTAQESGKTLTQIAVSKGISKTALVDKLVAAAKADLAAEVKAGRLTQAQADARSTDLTARITARVDRVGRRGGGPGGPGRGWGGPDGDHDGDGPGATGAPGTATPAPTPSAGTSIAPSGTTTAGSTVSA